MALHATANRALGAESLRECRACAAVSRHAGATRCPIPSTSLTHRLWLNLLIAAALLCFPSIATPQPDLNLLLGVEPAIAAPGDLVTYTFSVDLRGSGATDPAAVYVVVPPGTQFVEAGNGGTLAGDTLVWHFPVLVSNTGGIGWFRVQVAPGASPATVIPCHGIVVHPAQKAIARSAPVTTIVARHGAPLALSKRVDRTTVHPRGTVTYTLAYANLGDAPVEQVVLLDPLPAGLTFLDADASVTIEEVTGALRFEQGDIPPGSIGAVSFRARVEAGDGDTVTNQAQLAAAGLSRPLESDPVSIAVQHTPPAGSYNRVTGSSQSTSLTVDEGNGFTLVTSSSAGTKALVVQGKLRHDGSFDVTPAAGGARLSGAVDAARETASVTVRQEGSLPNTEVLRRARDAEPLPPPLIGTFHGSAVSPTGDWLRLRLTTDPAGNATYHADLIPFGQASRSRSGAAQVTPDGRLLLDAQPDGQFELSAEGLTLTYTVTADDGYEAAFQVPLVRR